MTDPKPKRHWFHPTPGWLILTLLVVECLLWLSERFRWFAFNQHKGWTVLITVAVVGLAFLLMLLWFVVSFLFRWRFQFSLQSLLVLTVAVAIPCSWLAVEMKAAKRQKDAVNMLMSSGCRVFYDSIDEKGNIDLTKILDPDEKGNFDLPKPLVSSYYQEWLDDRLGSEFFVTATHFFVVGESPISTQYSSPFVYAHHTHDEVDVMLLALRNLPGIRYLDLSGLPINDSDLESLAPLTELRHVDLASTQVTDAGLKHIERFAKLQELLLNDTKVTDAELKHLKGFTKLQRLDLSRTGVTDAGLEHIECFAKLRELLVNRTKVTDDGVKKLQQALPKCEITR